MHSATVKNRVVKYRIKNFNLNLSLIHNPYLMITNPLHHYSQNHEPVRKVGPRSCCVVNLKMIYYRLLLQVGHYVMSINSVISRLKIL